MNLPRFLPTILENKMPKVQPQLNGISEELISLLISNSASLHNLQILDSYGNHVIADKYLVS